MNVWTRAELLELLALWKAAYRAAATGKSYTIDDHTLTRQDLPAIRSQLSFLQAELEKLDGQGGAKRVFLRVDRGWRGQ